MTSLSSLAHSWRIKLLRCRGDLIAAFRFASGRFSLSTPKAPSANLAVRQGERTGASRSRMLFSATEKHDVQVFVRDNDVEQALRILKKKMQREGVFREMRRRRFYEKPSERATREKADAVRRLHKLARKQAIRDGLIAAPTRKRPDDKRGTKPRA
jgi:small subunit ribosomal protein S21